MAPTANCTEVWVYIHIRIKLFYGCMKLDVCVGVGVHERAWCVCLCVYTCTCMWRPQVNVSYFSLVVFHLIFLIQNLSLNEEHISSARLANQQAPWAFLHLPPQCWSCTHMLTLAGFFCFLFSLQCGCWGATVLMVPRLQHLIVCLSNRPIFLRRLHPLIQQT